MTDLFHTRIRQSLADKNLQAALDANAERRIHVRQVAFSSLAEPEQLRAQAHQVRAEVIEHLYTYLEQFINQARENGIHVHQASDASEAINIILNMAAQQGDLLFAKSKTMVSEEIGLNHELEKRGLQVVETDLGEYIVQLRGEAPSHIITPAVHLRRQDVGKLFEQKLGLAYTEDISLMTGVARKILRQVFLNADVGISGVNFGVVETGTLCIVTNEGNGRMVTTFPHTHIALMGIERLVPSMADLALMLSLLPRSATGQKLSVYTSLLNSPRRENDPDGPQERHLILVDNGRREVRESPLREILYCIRCGACLNACPVFREIGGHAYVGVNGKGSPYSGPMGSVLSPALFGQSEFGQLARASSLCGACKEACPVDIDLPKLLLRVRAGLVPEQTKPNAPATLAGGLGAYSMAASSARRFALAQRVAGFLGSLATALHRQDPWIHLPAISGWGLSKDFPRPASKPFHTRYRNSMRTIEAEPGNKTSAKDIPDGNPDQVDTTTHLAQENLMMRFAAELETLGGKFIPCERDDALQKVIDILRERQIDEILAWEAPHLPEIILEGLSGTGIKVRNPNIETIKADSQVRAGLTGARAAVAETGSLLVLGGAGQPLIASLLPELHIALIREDDIYAQLDKVLQQDDINHASAAVLITGPSRTADIEMTLTIGVHGPRELYIICIRNPGKTERNN